MYAYGLFHYTQYTHTHIHIHLHAAGRTTWRSIQKFLNLPPGLKWASRIACCHQMPQHQSCLSQSKEYGHYNPLDCFSGGVCYCVLYMQSTTSDGWFEGTMHWHEVSLQTWRGNCIRNSENKTWVYSYIPHLQKVTQVSLEIKTMLMLFFDCQAIVH